MARFKGHQVAISLWGLLLVSALLIGRTLFGDLYSWASPLGVEQIAVSQTYSRYLAASGLGLALLGILSLGLVSRASPGWALLLSPVLLAVHAGAFAFMPTLLFPGGSMEPWLVVAVVSMPFYLLGTPALIVARWLGARIAGGGAWPLGVGLTLAVFAGIYLVVLYTVQHL